MLILSLVALLAASPLPAVPPLAPAIPAVYPRDQYGTEPPPPGYSFFPHHKILRFEYPVEQISRMCFPMPIPFILYGCSKPSSAFITGFIQNAYVPAEDREKVRKAYASDHTLCVVILPEVSGNITFGWQWSIWTHELVHCNGLEHDATAQGWFTHNGTEVHP